MNFFGIVFYIVIIAIFISAKRAAQSGHEQNKSRDYNKTTGNYSGQKAMPKNINTGMPNTAKKISTVIPNVPTRKKAVRTYMEPHREEALQPRIKTNSLWGEDEHAKQRVVALRLMEGDPVPEGYVKIKCPYCAADNLVTKHCKQYHSCYFCRVPID